MFEFKVKKVNHSDCNLQTFVIQNVEQLEIDLIIEDFAPDSFEGFQLTEGSKRVSKMSSKNDDIDLDFVLKDRGLDVYYMQEAINEFRQN